MTSPKVLGELVSLAGGRIVGRIKLQKSVCALELTGLGYGFQFNYRHFGPYSEDLKIACGDADALGYISERTETANWGGWYSVFESKEVVNPSNLEQKQRSKLLQVAANADSVELELAITAAFLASKGVADPWREVQVRKSSKAVPERMKAAKVLYQMLASVETPRPLPPIV